MCVESGLYSTHFARTSGGVLRSGRSRDTANLLGTRRAVIVLDLGDYLTICRQSVGILSVLDCGIECNAKDTYVCLLARLLQEITIGGVS